MEIGGIKGKDIIFYGGTLVAIVFFFTTIKQDLALQIQKTDFLIAEVQKINKGVDTANGKLGQHDIDITNLKKDVDFLGRAQGIPVSTSRSQSSASRESAPLASRSSGSQNNMEVNVERQDEPERPSDENEPPFSFSEEAEDAIERTPIVSDIARALQGN